MVKLPKQVNWQDALKNAMIDPAKLQHIVGGNGTPSDLVAGTDTADFIGDYDIIG